MYDIGGIIIRSIKRITAAIAIICIVCNYNATIFANTKTVESSASVISASNELITELDKTSIDLGNGLISEEEYNKKLIDIYNLNNSNDNTGSKVRKANSAYYPEVECGYIKYSGVKYLYKEGLKKTKVATTAISLMMSAVPGCGWGLSVVSVASSYGGYSALEKAVHKAYYKKKGIKVYYKIHKSVMSMNKVRYVVG